MERIENLVTQYNSFILKLNPSKTWQVTRFILHWLTLPLKVVAIAGLGTYQILSKLKVKSRPLPESKSLETRKQYFRGPFAFMPVVKIDGEELYVNRVPLSQAPDGTNHIYDHQASRQGTYAFIMGKLGRRNYRIDNALAAHIVDGNLARGYAYHFLDGDKIYNFDHVSGDMLCGMSLGMLGAESENLKRKFAQLVENIVTKNDYAILENDRSKKSERGMWQPGIETVGAQALTLLAALRVADKICGSKVAKKAYNKMLLTYGYGLLSLFPTAYIDSQRGYYNDHNCLMCLYVLSRLSDNGLGRSFWKVPMVYVWFLSRHWYNGYYTGLVRECYPNSISNDYVEKCKAYLYEETPRTYGADVGYTYSEEVPVKYNQIPEDEFSPDIKQNIIANSYGDSEKIRTGLGFVSQAVMLEASPKALL